LLTSAVGPPEADAHFLQDLIDLVGRQPMVRPDVADHLAEPREEGFQRSRDTVRRTGHEPQAIRLVLPCNTEASDRTMSLTSVSRADDRGDPKPKS
jgi:hypothetical protein